jgi:hypothetical protein
MAAKMSVLGLILSSYPYLRSVMVRFLLIHSLIQWSFCSESLRDCLSETVKVGELKKIERLFTLHHVSLVTCHMLGVTCHMTGVTCHLKTKIIWQSVGASRWSICYQQGLPCLVLLYLCHYPSTPRGSVFQCLVYWYSFQFSLTLLNIQPCPSADMEFVKKFTQASSFKTKLYPKVRKSQWTQDRDKTA